MIPTMQRGEQIRDSLMEFGLAATLDPSAINPPMILVSPPSLVFDVPSGASAEWKLVLVLPGTGGIDTWAAADAVTTVLADMDELLVLDAVPGVTSTVTGTSYPTITYTLKETLS